MIQTEIYGKWIDGTDLIRTWSDAGKYIMNPEGIKYVEAIDPEIMHRTYTETDEDIEDVSDSEALRQLTEALDEADAD